MAYGWSGSQGELEDVKKRTFANMLLPIPARTPDDLGPSLFKLIQLTEIVIILRRMT